MDDGVYIDQSAEVLRLTVLEGALDVSQFSILSQGEAHNDRYAVQAGIIGASHFLSVTLPDGRQLHEVFACTDVDSPSRRVFYGPVGKTPGGVAVKLFENAAYSFTPRLTPWGEGVALLEELEDTARRASQSKSPVIGLSFDFPIQSGDSRVPKTIVCVKLEDHAVTANTVHAYPNEDTIVFTTTFLEVKG